MEVVFYTSKFIYLPFLEHIFSSFYHFGQFVGSILPHYFYILKAETLILQSCAEHVLAGAPHWACLNVRLTFVATHSQARGLRCCLAGVAARYSSCRDRHWSSVLCLRWSSSPFHNLSKTSIARSGPARPQLPCFSNPDVWCNRLSVFWNTVSIRHYLSNQYCLSCFLSFDQVSLIGCQYLYLLFSNYKSANSIFFISSYRVCLECRSAQIGSLK